MAQSILDAANVIIPTGNPSEGCYDGKGGNKEGGCQYEHALTCHIQNWVIDM